ncbi:helix-turn-helix domain-containing protein [Devosia enhydra]|uniref:helix-turn-helix domain-containing protein n=1 Tax=Devosia enhydra TaxID=665118 RepID=UPI0015A52AD5|nr:helix-turn-helix domain-containing protein [Devosia enhydra]
MQAPSLTVDLVQLCLLLCALISLVCLWLAHLLRRRPMQLVLWALSGGLTSIAILLIVLRGNIPDLASILVANLMLIAGHAFMAAGARAMAGQTQAGLMPLAAVAAAAFAAAYVSGAELPQRVALVSAIIAGFALVSLQSFMVHARRSRSVILRVAMVALGGTALGMAIRALMHLRVGGLEMQPDFDSLIVALGVTVTLAMSIALVAISARQFLIPAPGEGRVAMEDGQEARTAVVPDPDIARPPEATIAPVSGWGLRSGDWLLRMPNGASLKLTGNEYLVLQRLVQAGEDSPVPRPVLNALIGRPAENPKDRAIDILISRLRRKCAEAGGDLPVLAVRGQGYLFSGAVLRDWDGTAEK